MHHPLTPIGAGERIEALDVLRGFALLGILLMNIEAFVGPVIESLSGVNPRFTGADRAVDAAIYVLVQGKFFTLFSLLFGMGFAVMLQRADAAGTSGTRLYARRLFALAGIGLAHALLVWSGDILLTYALLGIVLLLAFRRTPVSRLPKWGIALYLLPMLFVWLWALGMAAAQLDPQSAASAQASMAQQGREMAALADAQRQAYGSGSYAEAVAQRAADTAAMLGIGVFGAGGLILGMFLFGAWFVRSGVMANPAAHLPLFRRLRNVGLGLGLPLMLWSAWLHPTMSMAGIDMRAALAQSAALVANLLLCLGYMACVVLALQHPAWAARLRWFAPAGRMALTNYLLQSIICSHYFYGYALGHFGMGRAAQLLLVVVVFIAQIALSHWWLARFRYGPMEWLWRGFTYRQVPPFRIASSKPMVAAAA